MHWWDVYPGPGSCPAPFNSQDEWGIVPAWGYGHVLESTIEAIKPGSLLWGMWPTSSHTFDLRLEPSELDGHWKETSLHRSKLMTVYNRYEQTEPSALADMQMAALFRPLWGGPNLINSSVFSSRRIHPFGFGAPWSEEDADLSAAVVVSLSASSKTGRSFFWELARNRDTAKDGPLGLLQLTSAPDTLPSLETQLPVKSTSYTDSEAVTWLEKLEPTRIVIVDFGAPDAALQSLLASLSNLPISPSLTILAVGYENKVYTADEIQARLATSASKVQLNTSGLRDQAIKVLGAEEYFREFDEAWRRCVKDQTFGNITIQNLGAVEGPQGIEGAWGDLCSRKVPPSIGLVIDLQNGSAFGKTGASS